LKRRSAEDLIVHGDATQTGDLHAVEEVLCARLLRRFPGVAFLCEKLPSGFDAPPSAPLNIIPNDAVAEDINGDGLADLQRFSDVCDLPARVV